MKVLSSIFLSFTMFLLLVLSANAQIPSEIYGIGSEQRKCVNCDCQECELPADAICCKSVETTTNGIGPGLGPSTLYKIAIDGTPTEVGPIGFNNCQAMDFEPETEDLYAVCENSFINENKGLDVAINNGPFQNIVLVHLNKDTGEGTEIGPLGLGGRNQAFVSDISFRSDGKLFAHVNSDIFCEEAVNPESSTSTNSEFCGNQLGHINLDTGYLKIIGPTDNFDFYSAIGFIPNNTLYQCANGVSKLFGAEMNILNQDTGHATFIRPIIFPGDPFERENIIASKDYDFRSRHFYGFVNSFSETNGIPAAATNNFEEDGSYLVSINILSGRVEVLGQTSDTTEDFLAIAVLSERVSNVPTMSEYGLIVTVVLLLGAAVFYLRRKQGSSQI